MEDLGVKFINGKVKAWKNRVVEIGQVLEENKKLNEKKWATVRVVSRG